MNAFSLTTLIAAATLSTLASAQSTDRGLYGELAYVRMDYKEPSVHTTTDAVRAFFGNNASDNVVVEAMVGAGVGNGSGTLLGVPYTTRINNMLGVFVKLRAKPTPELEFFGRIGYNRIGRTVDVLSFSNAEAGDDVAYGLGASLKVGARTYVTADYMSYYNVNNVSFQGASAGLRFRF
jgi:hypothetical protein